MSSTVQGPVTPICDSIISSAAAYWADSGVGATQPWTQSANGVAAVSGVDVGARVGGGWVTTGVARGGVGVGALVGVGIGVSGGSVGVGLGRPNDERSVIGRDADGPGDDDAARQAISSRQATTARATRFIRDSRC